MTLTYDILKFDVIVTSQWCQPNDNYTTNAHQIHMKIFFFFFLSYIWER